MIIQLESKREVAAGEVLSLLFDEAIETHDRNLIRKLRRLWGNEEWKEIKRKWQSEGSTWYVWQMDGVRAFIRRNTKRQPTHCDGCDKMRFDVRSMGRDNNGDPDAPDYCFICRKEGERRKAYNVKTKRYERIM